MKPTKSVVLATWMLERLTFGPHHEALSGDLLEELQQGRSVGWYWRQVFAAIGVGLANRCRSYTQPLAFSIGWSMFYPAWWLYVERSKFVVAMFDRWLALDWLFSSLLKLVEGIVPMLMFSWLGFFVYLMSHPATLRGLSKPGLLRSLSLSLNVLLISFVLHFKPSEADLRNATRESLYGNLPLIALSGALAVSLMSAIVSARSSMLRRRRSTAS
jgi:hypothetical protein